jgi:ankyrin repeat protein
VREADLSRREQSEYWDLSQAVKAGNWQRASELLTKKPSYALVADDLGHTLLHVAARAGRCDLVRLLVAHGADVNYHNEFIIGDTPLDFVINFPPENVEEVIDTLISAGASPNIATWMWNTALDRAAKMFKEAQDSAARERARRIFLRLRRACGNFPPPDLRGEGVPWPPRPFDRKGK